MQKIIKIRKISIGNKKPFTLIAGPCVIENEKTVLKIAGTLKRIAVKERIPLIFKASYDKANRTSVNSFRGLGMERGLSILKRVKNELDLPVLSDVHSVSEMAAASENLDVIQIPAFLCRQTDLLMAAGKTNKVINIKKGQFMAPWEMREAVRKIEKTGNEKIMITERGVSFGYNNLVSDFRSLEIMKEFGYPVVFDATHSVQQPGGLGTASGGQSEFIPVLARCAMATGCAAIFLETHPDPRKAKSDGPNMMPLKKLKGLLKKLKALDHVVKHFKDREK